VFKKGLVSLSFFCFLFLLNTSSNLDLFAATPEFKILNQPKSAYRLGQSIEYKILVSLEQMPEQARLNSPTYDLENLELVNVRQETITEDTTSDGASTQMLTFVFKSVLPGTAEIKNLKIRWALPDGTENYEYELPPVKIKISRPLSAYYKIVAIVWCGIAFPVILYFWVSWKKKKAEENTIVELSLEDKASRKLKEIREHVEEKDPRNALKEATSIFNDYLEQTTEWCSKTGDIELLKQQAAQKWSRKESDHICQLIKELECARFGGDFENINKVKTLINSITLFIESKTSI